MNREETLALYEQGKDAWNKWANEMLNTREELIRTNKWDAGRNHLGYLLYQSQETRNWYAEAEVNFSTDKNPLSFKTDMDFSNYIFPGNTRFNCAKFYKKALFNRANFMHGDAFFKNVTFESKVRFDKSSFIQEVWFEGTLFNSESKFDHTCFGIKSIFQNAKFLNETSFIYTIFDGISSFENVEFNENVSFENANFKNDTSFDNSKFIGITNFNYTKFLKNTSFITAIFRKHSSFSNALFQQNSNFNSIHANSAFNLEEAVFIKEVPGFIQAHFEEAPRLDHIQFATTIAPGNFWLSIMNPIPKEIKARYQALKRLAIQAHDHENEQLFWAGELRSDRSLKVKEVYKDEKGKLVEIEKWKLRPLVSAFWWGNIAYGFVSDYGRSIVKPLSALFILISLMTGLHLTASKTPLTYDKAFSASYISTNKSFLYLGADPTKRTILNEKYRNLYGTVKKQSQIPKIPKSILVAEFTQTLLSAILIFLTLLGIRNNFKLK